MNLKDIQERFQESTEKDHWEKLKILLFSEDKESVVQGISLIEQLDEEVYYDGVCMFLEDDGKGNWILKKGLGCKNELVLLVELYRMASEVYGHELKGVYEKGFFNAMFFEHFEHVNFSNLDEYLQETLLSSVREMQDISVETFFMGSPEDEEGRLINETRHEIALKTDFRIMKYQVTQALWESVMENNPSAFKGASRPVDSVSWVDCIIFANKLSDKEGLQKVYQIPQELEEVYQNRSYNFQRKVREKLNEIKMNIGANGYRLPTEAEWEYAAKGSENFIYSGSNVLDEVGWYRENSENQTHGVGLKKTNGYGLHDMSGNVFEWCWDSYVHDLSIVEDDELGEPTSRKYCTVRGGFWGSIPSGVRVSARSSGEPSIQEDDGNGFRLVCRQ